MKKRNYSIVTLGLLFIFCAVMAIGCAGCGGATTKSNAGKDKGGVLCLKVNPEIAITYDAKGLVTAVDSRNDDGKKIIKGYADFKGKECRLVVEELVAKIGEAGYFVEEIEGKKRSIIIEIEKGSVLPNEDFLDDIASTVRTQVHENNWHTPLIIEGESDYGLSDYEDTDYGPNNDGDTDYDDKKDGDSDYDTNKDGDSDYKAPQKAGAKDGDSDYDDTDYGPNNDGDTDYKAPQKADTKDGDSDYDDTDYKEPQKADTKDGDSDYDDSDYGKK